MFPPSFGSLEAATPQGILAVTAPLRNAGGRHGLAPVNGWRGDTSIEKCVEYDLYYVRHWTLAFDLFIVLLTFLRGFTDKNAYGFLPDRDPDCFLRFSFRCFFTGRRKFKW